MSLQNYYFNVPRDRYYAKKEEYKKQIIGKINELPNVIGHDVQKKNY